MVTLLSIFKIARNRNFHISSPDVLKPGQIIQGEINKIYHNNNAQINIGNKVVIAQLEAPLAVGGHYYFQVESVSDQVQLKVIGQKTSNQSTQNIDDLMRLLDVRSNQINKSFIQHLMKHHIPFSQTQVKMAIQLLGQVTNKEVAQNILHYMISENLPLTEEVFQALYTVYTEDLSNQLHQFRQQLLNKQESISTIEQQLIDRIDPMVSNITDRSPMTQITEEGSQNLFNLVKATGLIENVDFFTWKLEWDNFVTHQTNSSKAIPFNLDVEKSIEALLFIKDHQHQLKQHAQKLLDRWVMISSEGTLTIKDFTLFKQEINQIIAPLFTRFPTYDFMQAMQNNSVHIQQILSILQTLANGQSYEQIDDILHLSTNEANDGLTPKQMFLTLLNRMINSMGLTDENLVFNEQFNQTTPSIKSMIIQLLQQNDPSITEHAQQLLHFINGIQLQSVHETNHFIYASLLLPGEKLNLNSDLQLEFESKKTKDGKINPNFCRILFYLDLKNIAETIIDMHIQNRFVSITVFNDQNKIKDQCTRLQPLLKESLKDYDYELTNIHVKPLQNQTSFEKTKPVQQKSKSYKGIDYRI